jgi:uncharacterized protein
MRRDDVLQALAARLPVMESRFGVRSVGLFGSHARDEAGPESGVDLLVDFSRPPSFSDYMGLIEYLERELGTDVDVATPKKLKRRVRPHVEKELIRVA